MVNENIETKKKETPVIPQMNNPAVKEETIQNLHTNIKQENEDTLADFYNQENENDLKKQIAQGNFKQDSYKNENINTDYLISNNLNVNKISSPQQNDILLMKLNRIIEMFEEQKDIRTNQKNEETVLYCFLGIFVIYVLDSFVKIGKYKR
uniref:Uncharacterized protein n=1 Tax=viral metagenome TaxID=1070528 RepID=A0A6C0KIX1_9ZZZZ